MSDRVVNCPECDGQGGFERYDGWFSYEGDLSPSTEWSPCTYCDGAGECVVVTDLVAFYDLDSPEFTGRWPEPSHWEPEGEEQ